MNFIRELFAIDVYLDIPPEDPEQDAVFAPPWSTLPWHLTVLMEEAVGRGWAAFSQTEAMRRGVEWLDLVRSDGLKTRLAALVDEFEQHAFRPAILQSLVSAEEARKRWAALSAFYRSHGHFLVTNGAYQLKSWSGKSVSVEAFRDLSYPLGVGSYDTYAIPRRGYVTKVEREKGGLRLSADIEIVMKFMRDYQIVRLSSFLERTRTPQDPGRLTALRIEACIVKYSHTYLRALVTLGFVPPFALLVSLIGFKGVPYSFTMGNSLLEDGAGILDRDQLHFQEVIIEGVRPNPYEYAEQLRPLLDQTANAAGRATTPSFDASGRFRVKVDY